MSTKTRLTKNLLLFVLKKTHTQKNSMSKEHWNEHSTMIWK